MPESVNKHNLIADKITKRLIEERSYANSETKSLFEGIIKQALDSGVEAKNLSRVISQQVSLLTGIPYSQWASIVVPSLTDMNEINVPSSFYDCVSAFLPPDKFKRIGNIDVSMADPILNYKKLTDIDHKLELDSAEEKWGLLSVFALSGCIHSRLSLGNLLIPLNCNDPIIADNRELGVEILEGALSVIFKCVDEGREPYIQYEARFLGLLCESSYKLYEHKAKSNKSGALKFFKYANDNASNFSRVRKIISQTRSRGVH
tara:strand:- start:2883 stop:3665 length:783 start_codon:yes stop_codon:yes gene_type:complete